MEWIERLEAACLQSGGDIHTEVLSMAGGDVRTCLLGLPVLFWSLVQQKLKRNFSNYPTAAHAAMSLNTIAQKPNETLHIYVSRYSRLHYAATDKTAQDNTDPTRIYHFVSSINNTSIADRIAKQVWYAPRTLQDAFERALILEARLQLAEGIHLGRSPHVMQVSTSVTCHHDGLGNWVHQVNVRDSHARSSACWKC